MLTRRELLKAALASPLLLFLPVERKTARVFYATQSIKFRERNEKEDWYVAINSPTKDKVVYGKDSIGIRVGWSKAKTIQNVNLRIYDH